jgi:hypothetical protein
METKNSFKSSTTKQLDDLSLQIYIYIETHSLVVDICV